MTKSPDRGVDARRGPVLSAKKRIFVAFAGIGLCLSTSVLAGVGLTFLNGANQAFNATAADLGCDTTETIALRSAFLDPKNLGYKLIGPYVRDVLPKRTLVNETFRLFDKLSNYDGKAGVTDIADDPRLQEFNEYASFGTFAQQILIQQAGNICGPQE